MTLTLTALILVALMAAPEPQPAATVLFVCEHGSAKSVVAAAHFNQLAAAAAFRSAPSREAPCRTPRWLRRRSRACIETD